MQIVGYNITENEEVSEDWINGAANGKGQGE